MAVHLVEVRIALPRCGLIGAVLDLNILDAHSQHDREAGSARGGLIACELSIFLMRRLPRASLVVSEADWVERNRKR